ncbi:hypothetical protein [Herminiimonas fonticola]|uniref:hypothetical protein n=1 Tax=Herminiimonas fonticola TaxID=303380 RepID=UPI000DDB21B5|nr:hypothetical protein [Herminiimonas fonticola]
MRAKQILCVEFFARQQTQFYAVQALIAGDGIWRSLEGKLFDMNLPRLNNLSIRNYMKLKRKFILCVAPYFT